MARRRGWEKRERRYQEDDRKRHEGGAELGEVNMSARLETIEDIERNEEERRRASVNVRAAAFLVTPF